MTQAMLCHRGRRCRDRREVAFNVPLPGPHPPDDAGARIVDGSAGDSWIDDGCHDRNSPAAGHDGGPSVEQLAETPSYHTLSRTPLTSLVFTLPLVLAYEGGVLLLGRGAPRNGADVWLRQSLDSLGFGAYFLLPTLTVLGLLAWHHVEHDRWHFSPRVLLGMTGESLLWALLLVGLARVQERLWPLAVATAAWEDVASRLVGYCGAGLYEEVLFRLLMLPAAAWLLERLGGSPGVALAGAILLTSTLFSTAHYVGPLGDVFEPYSFTFRVVAGIFFALVFLGRGFGIAAGAHAFYDMLVGLS